MNPCLAFRLLRSLLPLVLALTAPGCAAMATPPPPSDLVQRIKEAGKREPESALDLARKSLEAGKNLAGTAEYSRLLLVAADLAQDQGHYTEAEVWALQCAEWAAGRRDSLLEGQARLVLGRTRKYLARYDAAIGDLKRAESLFEQAGSPLDQVACVEGIGLVLRRIGDLPGALDYLQRAQQACERLGALDRLLSILNNLGLVQMDLGQAGRARETFEAGLKLSESLGGQEVSTAHLLENLADLSIREGKIAEAMPFIGRALGLMLRHKKWKSYGSALLTQGMLHQRLRRFDQAEETYRKALAVYERIQEAYGTSMSLIRLGSNDRERDRLEAAAASLEQGLAIAGRIKARRVEALANRELSRVYRDQGDSARSLARFERFYELQEAAASEENRQLLAHLQIRFDLQRREQEIRFLKHDVERRDGELRKLTRWRNTILGVTTLALALAAALYLKFRQARRLLGQLRESEAQFRTLAEQAPMGIWILQEGRIRYVNPVAAHLFGKEPADFVGRDPDALIQRQTTEGPFTGAVGMDAQGRRLHLELYTGGMHLAGREAVLETFVDMTQRREVELELARYRQSLLELVEERTQQLESVHRELLIRERLSVLGRLTATVAHELRNPLGAIRSSLFALHQGLASGDPQFLSDALASAERNTLRCDNLVQELLTYTAPKPLAKVPTPPAAWLGEVLEEVRLPAGIRLERHFKPCPPLLLDQERLRRAVLNLVENASHAIQGRGGAGCIRVDLACRGGWLELCIADDGVGIPEQDMARVFEPLFSTKSFGFGLGLPEVKDVVERHGGTLHLESRSGQGTQVTLRLPAP